MDKKYTDADATEAIGQLVVLGLVMLIVWFGFYNLVAALMIGFTIAIPVLLAAGMSELHKHTKPEKA